MNYKVMSPEKMNATFSEAFNSGSVDNLMRLYEPDAKLVRLDGSIAQGREAIREELSNLLKIGKRAIAENPYTIISENIALLRANFTITAVNKENQEVEIKGSTSEVVRRQADGSWLYIIDHPFGANPNA